MLSIVSRYNSLFWIFLDRFSNIFRYYVVYPGEKNKNFYGKITWFCRDLQWVYMYFAWKNSKGAQTMIILFSSKHMKKTSFKIVGRISANSIVINKLSLTSMLALMLTGFMKLHNKFTKRYQNLPFKSAHPHKSYLKVYRHLCSFACYVPVKTNLRKNWGTINWSRNKESAAFKHLVSYSRRQQQHWIAPTDEADQNYVKSFLIWLLHEKF